MGKDPRQQGKKKNAAEDKHGPKGKNRPKDGRFEQEKPNGKA